VLRSRAFRIAKTLKGEEVARDLIDGMFGKRIRDNGTLAIVRQISSVPQKQPLTPPTPLSLGEKGEQEDKTYLDSYNESTKDEEQKEKQKEEDKPTGSRLIVHETVIKKGIVDRVQNRVKLDRFTGGAYPQALFNQQPLFAKATSPTRVKIQLELRKTPDAHHFDAEVGLLLLVLKVLWTGDLPLGGESSIGRGRLQGEKVTLSLGETSWLLTQSADGSLQFGGNGNRAELENKYLQALKEL
jgi:CRISPR/Cas system CSM-associated protein Csm3 (group 7 of RAMP superfamily)